jgi:ribosomal protein L33
MDETIQKIIEEVLLDYSNIDIKNNIFEEILTFGELVDRLTITNIKLYNLKNDVMRSTDEKFKSDSCITDVRLVEERSKLKSAITSKLMYCIKKVINNKPELVEVKKYG